MENGEGFGSKTKKNSLDLFSSNRDSMKTVATGPRLEDADFDEWYFTHHCGIPYRRDEHWLRFFRPIADHIVSDIRPRRVLDAGCALGLLVEMLRDRGVEAYGLDFSSYAIAHVLPSVRPFCWRASVSDELTGRYDLIFCQEVFAHVAPPDDEAAIANFCRHTDDVLFSASPVDPTLRRHVNPNPSEYFAELFARHGFYRDFAFDASFMTPWAVRYRRLKGAVPQVIRQYEGRLLELRDRLHETQQTMVRGQDTIFHIGRNWYWRARKLWTKLRGR